jgi:hypothetical protein
MRGGAQSHLMRCSDGYFYVVKFQNNPQHIRVLANEMLATRLAEKIGLPVPLSEVVEVSDWLVSSTAELQVELGAEREPCRAGKCFGSRYLADPLHGTVHAMDYMPEDQYPRVQNLADFAGVLCFDKWTCNANGRQAVFVRTLRQKLYRAVFIDFGYCFNAELWDFPDAPLRGIFSRNAVYSGVKGWESFEPWLTNLERLTEDQIGAIASTIPPEWYGDWDAMEQLIAQLAKRRTKVRDMLTAFQKSSRSPFPNWNEARVMVM